MELECGDSVRVGLCNCASIRVGMVLFHKNDCPALQVVKE